MKKKILTLTAMIFVLLTSLVFAKDDMQLIDRVELSKGIKSQIKSNLHSPDISGNWLHEDPLGYLSIEELKVVFNKVNGILTVGKANVQEMSAQEQFDILSFVIDSRSSKNFKEIIDMGFDSEITVTIGERTANIFTQIVLSENKDALDYLYITLPYEILEKEMYAAMQFLINRNACKNYGKPDFKKISAKYAAKTATFEDLAQAVISGKLEGSAELEIAYNSIPKKDKVKELYPAFLSLIYYQKNK